MWKRWEINEEYKSGLSRLLNSLTICAKGVQTLVNLQHQNNLACCFVRMCAGLIVGILVHLTQTEDVII